MSLNDVVEESDTIDSSVNDDSEPSIRDTLEAAYDKFSSEESTDDEQGIESSSGRDANGRFLSKSPKALDSSPGETIEGEQRRVREPETFAVPVPQSWAADAKDMFNQLPARLQQEVVKRETDLRRGLSHATERASQVERTWAEVDEALAPHRETFALNGVSPGQVVKQFLDWQNYLDKDPVLGLQKLAKSYGLDLRQLAEYEATQPQEDPQVKELRQQISQMQGYFQQMQQQTASQKAQAVQGELELFAQEIDSTGRPLRPYIEHVADDMIPHIQYLRSQNPNASPRQLLQAAYEKAIWANPSTRELELKRSQAVNPAQLDKARRAQKLVNGEAHGMVAPEEPDTVRGALEAGWNKIHR